VLVAPRTSHLPLALSLKDRRERLYGPRSAINGTFHSGWRDILASREQKGHSLIASERDLHEAAVDKTPVFSEPHRRAERLVKRTIFASRWLLAPFYLGLAICLIVLLIKFVQKLVKLVTDTLFSGGNDMIPVVLSLIDLSLIANLLLIVMFSGYENFVSRFELDDQKYKPAWMGHVDFGELKLKLLTSIVAISAVHLLESFMNIDRRPMRPRLQLAPRPDQARVSRHQGGVVALMGVSTALAGMPSSILAIR
jgi:uncharacterized protein (TIGR00645 family)